MPGQETDVHARKDALQHYAVSEFGVFQPGTVVVLYCIDPHTAIGNNHDYVWWFQANGEFHVSREVFELKPFTEEIES